MRIKKTVDYLKKQNFKYKRQYKFDKLYLHEEIGEDKYRFVKVIK